MKIEYYQGGGSGVARFRWTGPSLSYGIIPSANLFPSASGATVPVCGHAAISGCARGLTVTYYDNMDFSGPSVARIDPTIDFDWGNGSPDPAIGSDSFSARWTGLDSARGDWNVHVRARDRRRRAAMGQRRARRRQVHRSGQHQVPGDRQPGRGTKYDIKMDYYENGGGAAAHLRISGPGVTYGAIPNSWLYPTGDNRRVGAHPSAPAVITAPATPTSFGSSRTPRHRAGQCQAKSPTIGDWQRGHDGPRLLTRRQEAGVRRR